MSFAVPLLAGLLTLAAALTLLSPSRVSVRSRVEPYVATPRSRPRPSLAVPQRVYALAEAVVGRFRVHDVLAQAVERAGTDLPLGAIVCLAGAAGVGGFVIGVGAAGIGSGLFFGVCGLAAPWLVLAARAKRRERAFEQQLPEILDTLSASLRAGHSFDQSLQAVATDIGQPAERELQRVVSEAHLGRALEDALADLGERVRSVDLTFVLSAIAIQREVGGSLATLFELVAETVRAREQFRRKVRALTSMVRTSATVLIALPVIVAAAITLLDPAYMRPLWHSSTGHLLVVGALVLMTIGSLALRRIGSVRG